MIEYNEFKDFTMLHAWEKARLLKLFFYREVIPLLPPEEKFNLNFQIRKASVSASANISEGYGRYHDKEAIQFYRISRGSINELKDHLLSCHDLNFVSQEIYEKGISLIEDAKITLNGYMKYVLSQKGKKTRISLFPHFPISLSPYLPETPRSGVSATLLNSTSDPSA